MTMLGDGKEDNEIFNNINNSIGNVSNNMINNTNISSENTNNTTNTVNSVENTNSSNVLNSIGNTNSISNTNETENNVNNELNINSNVKTFSFELQGITSEMAQYIKSEEKLTEAIKQYIYKYGFFDATIAEVQKYEYQETTGRIGIIFKLNNPDENRLRVIINSNGNIDISDYN
jgi:probable serine/threonine-protein kinase tsuA